MPSPDDQALLDRLSALRPGAAGGISLEKSANAVSPGPKAQPVSREDALAERLRLLRSQQPAKISRDESVSQSTGFPQPPGAPGDEGVGRAGSAPVEPPPGDLSRATKHKAVSKASSVSSPIASQIANQKQDPYWVPEAGADDADAYVELEGFEQEHFDLAADDDTTSNLDSSRDVKVAELLESLQNNPGSSMSQRVEDTSLEDHDDSDGEQMTHAIQAVLSQISDEIKSLPAPPGMLEQGTPSEETGGEQKSFTATSGNESPLALPAVPSQLVDPVFTTEEEGAFEKDISARLASLRGLGSLDELGLPSAPTFRPEDRRTSSTIAGKGLLRSNKYTDEDQTTWCVVCLEDATIRCVGCDNDVYCARCWKEMHVGPSAGYDERGHKWLKFQRRSHS
ncbi:uncharacterized protein B0T15DRAFT_498399 [Chaetomium strumarium]|uniref:Uncharacterized protein n=1 Tax=Chaetomium strumarium TaxID=1170767 RepID=A0AAJ0H1S5_9PEZI|nr:hypothetical protein B0T15DRAFT_498399 [Chaetomium strumarium]